MSMSVGRLGVRGRLLAAFLVISAFAVLGTVAALVSFAETNQAISEITRVRVPSMLTALQLSREAERLATAAPRLVADETDVERLRTDRLVRGQIGQLERLFAEVKSDRANDPAFADIEQSIAEIRQALAAIQKLRELENYSTAARDSISSSVARDELNALPRGEMLAIGQKLIQENIAASERLAAAVDRLVASEGARIAAAEAAVASTQHRSRLVLMGATLLSLVGSTLIVWLYVGRSIVRRITELSSTMLAVANGDLALQLPIGTHSDEIGRMAETLRVFRDKLEENERLNRLRSFLAPQVAELIVASGDDDVLNSHRRDVAVLFCDLRGFSAFAESADADAIMDFLQAYRETLGLLIEKYAGTLERFTGDGLLVLFNDPLPVPEPCLVAVQLATEMRTAASRIIRRTRATEDRLGFGIGIAFGCATLGKIGSRGRFEYTAIGSVVNLAARLCERATNGEVIIDSSVKSLLPDHVKTQALGQFRPKGFKRPIDIFNVLAEEENAA